MFKKKITKIIASIAVLSLLFTFICFSSSAAGSGESKIHFINVGNGDAIVLESDGKFAMIDTGEGSDFPDGSDPRYPDRPGITKNEGYEDKVLDYLQSLGVKELEFILLTHAHSDHMGGTKHIIKGIEAKEGKEAKAGIPVKNIYMKEYSDDFITDKSRLWDNRYEYDKTMEVIEEYDINLYQQFDEIPEAKRSIRKNPVVTLGNMQIELFNWQDQKDEKGDIKPVFCENAHSIVALVTSQGQKVLLTSDAVNTYGLVDDIADELEKEDISVLKLEHHGLSDEKNPDDVLVKKLLKQTDPKDPKLAVNSGYFQNISSSRIDAIASSSLPSGIGNKLILTEFYEPAMVLTLNSKGYVVANDYNFYYEPSGKHWECIQDGSKVKDKFVELYYRGEKATYYFDSDGVAPTGWQDIKGNRYYFNQYGFMLVGWQQIDGKWYYLSTGPMKTGWIVLNQKRYYLDPSTGVMQVGRLKLGDKIYCMAPSGEMQIGWGHVDGDKWCFCDENGIMLSSKWIFVNGAWYYLGEDGVMKTGWLLDKGNWYYLNNPNGNMATGWIFVNGAWYYLSGDGAMKKGWFLENGNWYYLNDPNGNMATGWVKVGDTWYYMNASGVMQTGWVFTGLWYFLAPSGAMQKGWLQDAGKTYYLDEKNGDMKTGTVIIGGKTYYFDSSGALQTG